MNERKPWQSTAVWYDGARKMELLIQSLSAKSYQYGRLPPAYFPPSHVGKDTSWKDESVFLILSIIFSNFSNFENLLIFGEKPGIEGAEVNFRKQYYLIRILQQICSP